MDTATSRDWSREARWARRELAAWDRGGGRRPAKAWEFAFIAVNQARVRLKLPRLRPEQRVGCRASELVMEAHGLNKLLRAEQGRLF